MPILFFVDDIPSQLLSVSSNLYDMSTNMSHPDAYYVIPRDVQHAINDGSIHVVIFAIVVLAAFFGSSSVDELELCDFIRRN